MGADMCLAWVPAVKVSEERLAVLQSIARQLPDRQLPDYDEYRDDEKQLAEIRQRLREAVAFLSVGSREVCYFRDDHLPYDCWCSGGLAWGDAPTDAYDHFTLIMDTLPIWDKLVEWAKTDKEAQP